MARKTETRPATGHINPFGLRMQPELRERLESAAAESGRSLNAEIVARLESSFSPSELEAMTVSDVIEEAVKKSIAEAEKRIARINRRLLMAEYANAGLAGPVLAARAKRAQEIREASDEIANDSLYAWASAKDSLIESREEELLDLSDQVDKLLNSANEAGIGSDEHQRLMTEVTRLNQLIAGVRSELMELSATETPPPSPGVKKKAK